MVNSSFAKPMEPLRKRREWFGSYRQPVEKHTASQSNQQSAGESASRSLDHGTQF